jgi:hypothetical protein
VETARSPDEINRLIDDALEEIERTELEMLDLLSDVLGPDNAQRVADEIAAQGSSSRFRRLLESRSRSADDQATPEDGVDATGVDQPA